MMSLMAGLAASGATPAPGTVAEVVDSMTSGLSTAGADILSAVSAIVPVALPVMIGIVVIGVGIKIFKKITGR